MIFLLGFVLHILGAIVAVASVGRFFMFLGDLCAFSGIGLMIGSVVVFIWRTLP